jgi:hypothetical protein
LQSGFWRKKTIAKTRSQNAKAAGFSGAYIKTKLKKEKFIMNIDLTAVAEAALALIGALITIYLIPWLRRKAGTERLAMLKTWAEIAVNAAEQLYTGSGHGEEKKAYVLKFLQSKGFTIDFDSLENIVESAVYELPGLIEIEETAAEG